LGIVSCIAAGHSYTDHKVQDYERAKNKRRIAYGFGIAAIVVGTFILILYMAWFDKMVHAVQGAMQLSCSGQVVHWYEETPH
jgi:hypothetical protein